MKTNSKRTLVVLPLLLSLTAASRADTTLLLDFGRHDGTQGNATASPDGNGNHWNNLSPAGGPMQIEADESFGPFVDTSGNSTGVGLTTTSVWRSNGRNNGGLLAPDPALLGDFAIGTATEDYWFTESGGSPALNNISTLELTGLDPAKAYRFRAFGTRNVTNTRETRYHFEGANGTFTDNIISSGTDIGSDGIYDGNDDHIVTVPGVIPKSDGSIDLTITAEQGGYGYLGILEITEIDGPLPSPATVRVDFGKDNGLDGNVTASPDTNGAYWNNLFANPIDVPVNYSVGNLVTIDNNETAIRLTCPANWRANGIRNGGLLAPDPSLLGDLAIGSATEDYFFTETGLGGTATLKIENLRADRKYDFRFFGTRDNTQTRRSAYVLDAAVGSATQELTTSGVGSGSAAHPNGNDDTVLLFEDVQTDEFGVATLTLSVLEGGFAYLGVMEIVEGEAAPVIEVLPPAPSSVAHWVAQDQIDPPAEGSVLFIGSSSIRRWDSLARNFADYKVIQRGFGGSLLSEMDDVAPYIVFPYNPSAIVMWAGTNDLTAGRTGEQVHADFITFHNLLRERMPDVPFLYLGITPTPSNGGSTAARQTANSLIRATADTDANTYFVDLPAYFEALTPAELDALYVDPVHVNRAGYAEWLNIIRPQLEAVLSPNKPAFDNPLAPVAGDRILFDLGPDDVLSIDGNATVNPDANGNHWNNWYSVNGGVTIHSGEHMAGLISSTGDASGLKWIITGGYQVNGLRNGALFPPNGPDPALLGELAIETATQDYFFSTADDLNGGGDDDLPGGFMLTGLNPDLSYEFRLFGSRENTSVRETEYGIFGATANEVPLQTSGTDIGSNGDYDGNDDEIISVTGVKPDEFGQIFLDMLVLQGGFAYLNAMEIIVTDSATPLENWRGENFTPEELGDAGLEESLWGNLADPDGDRLANLLEYATGSDPRAASPQPLTLSLDTNAEPPAFTATYPRNSLATDVELDVEASVDLIEWTRVANDALVSEDGGIEMRVATGSMEDRPTLMLRLACDLLENAE